MLQVATSHYVMIAGDEVFLRGGAVVDDDHPAVAINPSYFEPLTISPRPGASETAPTTRTEVGVDRPNGGG